MDDFYTARSRLIPPLPWPTFAPPFSDYMACLVGVDCIAVDRHIRGFAELAGLEDDSYDYLRDAFNFAADLLSIPRREFDASIWRYQSERNARQLSLEFVQ